MVLRMGTLAGAVMVFPAMARGDTPAPPVKPTDGEYFTIDPVSDGVVIGVGVGFSQILGAVLGTGEIRPTLPGDPKILLGIDRIAVTQKVDSHADLYSSIGLYAAYGYAVLDPVFSGVRTGRKGLLVDAILYAESISLSWAITNLIKIAVRRPRPIDYATCAASETGRCANDTNLQLSFFSGHASTTAAISATATYLAFMRAPLNSARPWITLGVGIALTTFVSYERVRSGAHFPTDVIMGSLAGAAVGVLVPHNHRRRFIHEHEVGAAPTWIGLGPVGGGQGSVTAGWIF
jgi:membrane-associated phospholipid phosphatase